MSLYSATPSTLTFAPITDPDTTVKLSVDNASLKFVNVLTPNTLNSTTFDSVTPLYVIVAVNVTSLNSASSNATNSPVCVITVISDDSHVTVTSSSPILTVGTVTKFNS